MEYMVYNHMYMPLDYGRDPLEDYRALTERVTLWDVGAERQTEIRGADALRFADYLCTRDLRSLETGRCRYTLVCDEEGEIMTEPIVLRPWDDVVWISHGNVDLTLWARGIAMHSDFRVEVSEPDVAPVQVQGPLSLEVLRKVAQGVEQLEFYGCCVTRVAGVDAVVSRTGWSGELGYEIYPLGSENALSLWGAVVEAGRPCGLLVTGPNLVRALEHGITDTHYSVNSGMNPFEAGKGRFVDLDAGPFVGREALRRALAAGIRRKTVGLAAGGEPFGRLEEFWPVVDGGEEVGVVRWAAYSFALGQNAAIALVDVHVEVGDAATIRHPLRPYKASVVELPFVS